MTRILALLIVAALVAWFAFSQSDTFPRAGEPGPFPSEWFMQQRTWPEPYLDPARVLNGAREAARMRNSSLDEDPFWVQRGPTNIGGRVTDIVGHPTNDSIYYVGSATGGIFKTIDGGRNYTPITDGLPTPSIGALALDPQNPNTIYCGTGEANSSGFSYFGSGLYKSTNAGDAWQLSGLADSRYIARIVVHPQDPSNVWVAAMGELFITGGERGIYFSDDAGATWERKLFVNDSTGACDVVVDPENPDVVYAATWQRIRTPEERRAGGRGTGIYKSINRGETWTRLSSGLPPIGDDVGRVGLAISQSNPNVLYASYADHPGYFLGVFRTADGGENWTQTNDGSLSDMYSNFGWYFGNIRVRPDDENMVFVFGVTLHRSSNGGASWAEIGNDVHVDHHAMWFDPQQPFRFLLGNDGGFYRTLNNGNDFSDLNNFPAIQYYAGSYDAHQPQRLYGGTQDNGTLRSMTGAVDEYERIYGGDGFYTLVDPSNNNYIYAEYQYGGLGRSTNGGDDFGWALNGIDDAERRNWSTPVVMDPNNPQVLYYGAERVYKTTNRAQSWTANSPDLTNGPGPGNLTFGTITTIAVSPVNSQVIFAGTDDANVWVTTNGGTNWELRNTGLPTRWITRVTPHPTDVNEALLTISGYRSAEQQAHLYRTTNQGQNWVEVGASLPDVPLNDVLYDSIYSNRIYVASDFGIFWSQDNGSTWAALGRGLPPVPTLDIIINNTARTLIAATYGRSFVTLPLDSLGSNHRPVIVSLTPDIAPGGSLNIVVGTTLDFAVEATDEDEDSLRSVWRVHGQEVSTSAEMQYQFTTTSSDCVSVDVSDGFLHVLGYIPVNVTLSGNEAAIPDRFGLTTYPNPFNNETRIAFTLEKAGQTRVTIYSITGQIVASLHDGMLISGEHSLAWRPEKNASGTYIAELQSGSMTARTKLVYLK